MPLLLKTIRSRIKNGWHVFVYNNERRAVIECGADRGKRSYLRSSEVDRAVIDKMIDRGELVSNHMVNPQRCECVRRTS